MSVALSAVSNSPSSPAETKPVQQETQQQNNPKPETDSPSAPRFTSPVVKVDDNTGYALLLIRDTSTGDVQAQYPSRQAVQEYQRNMVSNSQAKEAGGAAAAQAAQAAATATATAANSNDSSGSDSASKEASIEGTTAVA
ncbi:MAG: hypothetical protein ABT940_13560 [Alphaproteobacteria bacterium]